MIEPVEYNLRELKQRTKKNPNITIEEIAISDKDETVPFYCVKRSSMERLKKHWSSGIGSFNKHHLLNHRNKNFNILDEDIETFDELIEAVKIRAQEGEIFIRLDLKPPYPDTPKDWEEKIETAFNGYLK